MKQALIIKGLEYGAALVFGMLMLTSYLNLPPSGYFIAWYCKVFDTSSYYPMLIAALPALIYTLPVYFIKKKLANEQP